MRDFSRNSLAGTPSGTPSDGKKICGRRERLPKSAPVILNNFLLLDASSPLSAVAGKFDASGRAWSAFVEEKSAALEGVFAATAKLGNPDFPGGPHEAARESDGSARRGNVPVEIAGGFGLGGNFGGFLFCEGPGSILGIRIAAAAIRARLALEPTLPCFAFQSLNLAAQLILRAFPSERNFVVAAESRLNSCNILRVRDGVPEAHFEEIKAAATENFADEKIFALPSRRALPDAISRRATLCRPAELLARDAAVFADVPALLRDCGNAPDAVNTAAASSYVRWTPTRHSRDTVVPAR